MFIANSEIRVCRSPGEAHGRIVVDVNGSALHDMDSSAIARVESYSVISNGAAVSSDSLFTIDEGETTFELPGIRAMLYRPERIEPLAIARARSRAMALTGVFEMLVPRECSWLRRELLPLSKAVEWTESFVRAVSENLVDDCIPCQGIRALLAPAIPQVSNDTMTTIEKQKKIRGLEENIVCFDLLNFTEPHPYKRPKYFSLAADFVWKMRPGDKTHLDHSATAPHGHGR
jgi:hypothetical protein